MPLKSLRNNVKANIAYFVVFRAKVSATIYTDDRKGLADAIEMRDGTKAGAIDETLAHAKGAPIAISA